MPTVTRRLANIKKYFMSFNFIVLYNNKIIIPHQKWNVKTTIPHRHHDVCMKDKKDHRKDKTAAEAQARKLKFTTL